MVPWPSHDTQPHPLTIPEAASADKDIADSLLLLSWVNPHSLSHTGNDANIKAKERDAAVLARLFK